MRKHKIAVAGHLCLDLHPDLKSLPANALITPGKVFEIGDLGIGTGGSVSNTGISLFKLGVDTQLLTCVGDDMVSQMILESIAVHHPILIENIKSLKINTVPTPWFFLRKPGPHPNPLSRHQ